MAETAQRHAVVIGGARGIGEATVRRLVADGFAVTIADRLMADAQHLATELRGAGASATAIAVDITRADDLAELARVVRENTGSIGVAAAVNSVGIFNIRGPLRDTTLEEFRQLLDINLLGAFAFSNAIEPLLAPHASLVHIGSVNGILAGKDLGAYKVSKAGLHMMARCQALELARDERRIRVNVVAPGWVDTPGERQIHAARGGQSVLDDPDTANWIPLQRRTEAREIADAVGFLCSPQASAITGQILYVDNGITTTAVN